MEVLGAYHAISPRITVEIDGGVPNKGNECSCINSNITYGNNKRALLPVFFDKTTSNQRLN